MTESMQLEGQKEYEVGFLLTAEEAMVEVDKILSSASMAVVTKVPVVSLKLAYPIKKYTSAFFGSCVFMGLPENIKVIDKSLTSNSKVLRFLIMTPPVKVSVREQRVVSSLEVSPRAKTVQESPKPMADALVLSNEGLEKKLEEILK